MKSGPILIRLIDSVEFALVEYQMTKGGEARRTRAFCCVDSGRQLGFVMTLSGTSDMELRQSEKVLA